MSDVSSGEEEDAPEGLVEEQLADTLSDEKLPDNSLSPYMIPECLSLLCKIGNGLAHAYVRLDAHERDLTDIKILQCFIHLRYVDLTANLLHDISPISHLKHLLSLKVDKNHLTTSAVGTLPYLQVASFANNKVTSTEGAGHPLLEQLNFNSNQIALVSGLDPCVLANLHTLELRGNRLESTEGIYLPNLKKLYMAANIITSIKGLDRLEKLNLLHLRDNQISLLDGFSQQMKSLQYLNLRGNNLSSLKELQKLVCLPTLRAVVLNDNLCQEEDNYRVEVLIVLRRLERLDKDEYSEEERTEAEEMHEQRRQDEILKEQGGLQDDQPEEE